MKEMTKDEFIEEALSLINILAQYYPVHYEGSDVMFIRINKMNMARFTEDS